MDIKAIKNRIYKRAQLKMSLVSMTILFFIIAILTSLLFFIKEDIKPLVIILITLLTVIFLTGLWKQIYYLFLHKINDNDMVTRITIEPHKFKLKAYFGENLWSKYSSNYLGLVIFFKIDNKTIKIIYPFKNDLSLSASIRYKVVINILNKVSQIEKMDVSYLNSSKVIAECSINIERDIKKVYKSIQ